MVGDCIMRNDELSHHGILGQKWGIRRFRDKFGALTQEGKERYADYYRAGQRTASDLFFIKKKVDKVLERKEEKEKEVSEDPTAKIKDFIKTQGINKFKEFVETDKGKETIQKGSDALTKITSFVFKKGYQADPYIREGAKKVYSHAKEGAKVAGKAALKGSIKALKTLKKAAPSVLNAALSAPKYIDKSVNIINNVAKKSSRILKTASNTGSKALHTILKMRKAG